MTNYLCHKCSRRYAIRWRGDWWCGYCVAKEKGIVAKKVTVKRKPVLASEYMPRVCRVVGIDVRGMEG